MLQRRIFIRGQHLFKVNNETNHTLESMASETIVNAMRDAKVQPGEVSAVIVGNMLSGVLQKQSQLASLITQASGLQLAETFTIDTACGSGGSAFRAGCLAVLSGLHDTVIVAGVEEMKSAPRDDLTKALAQASHWKEEGAKGATFVGLNDLLHVLYCEQYPQVDPMDFYYFSATAHKNALTADHALLKKQVSLEDYSNSRLLGKRVRLFDACPTANGCAAIVLSSKGVLGQDPVVLGSDCKTDILTINKRKEPLRLRAVEESVKTAFKQAQIKAEDVSIFEAHDAYSIMAVLSLESTFCAPGKGLEFAKAGHIELNGQLPMSTFGGLKARGHPVGASGIYQIGELALQLKGLAGPNQVKNPKYGLTSSFGGAATTVTSHVLGI